MKKNILLVDGMALLFRGYYATAFTRNFMKTEAGVPTNGIYQFLRYFLSGIETYKPTHVICCWDMGSKTFRNDIFDQYKANRDAPPEELIPQFSLVKDVVESFNVPNVGIVNYEADDVIGSLATKFADEAYVTIQTGDFDMLQLVGNNIQVGIMKKGIGNYDTFTESNFFEKKGLHPEQIIDFKGLTGDSADNYPGVKGIGEKTALKLLQEYEKIETLLENIDKLTINMQNRINNDLDMLHLSRELATIKCDMRIDLDLEASIWNYDRHRVEEMFKQLEFKNIDVLLQT